MEFALIVWIISTVLPSLSMLISLTVVVTIIATVFAGVVSMFAEDSEPVVNLFKFFGRHKVFVGVVLFLSVTIPSERQGWMIAGAGAAQAVAQSEFASELGQESKELLLEIMKAGKDEIKKSVAKATEEAK